MSAHRGVDHREDLVEDVGGDAERRDVDEPLEEVSDETLRTGHSDHFRRRRQGGCARRRPSGCTLLAKRGAGPIFQQGAGGGNVSGVPVVEQGRLPGTGRGREGDHGFLRQDEGRHQQGHRHHRRQGQGVDGGHADPAADRQPAGEAEKALEDLGALAYALFQKGALADEGAKALCETIGSLDQQIAAKQAALGQGRPEEKPAAAVASAAGSALVKCDCGAENAAGVRFCSSCGKKLG